ncbi:ribosomal protein L6 [Tritrichomonas foetus]|uniref:Ribosomal protein L6 n=1 Tax=Tritrichomonas foetus TaxID=1144522 RepID=A0A1J4JYH0_9EUKA|nr:ribosomal protein L6 [Tritrichomonas foetus]OHT02542.1 ribosomal protein L6 [Tritrichomonas foetus]|eukprot:OHT02542.1 ribosomal protein L6 [Tritrichomonas foetus]
MPRPVLHQDHLKIEKDVKVQIKSGVVTITGKRGTLTRDLSCLHLDFEWDEAEKQVVARCWFGNRKLVARIGTLFGHIKNMITGVTRGYRYKMRFVTAHFPIKHTISDKNDEFAFTHFMGQREKKRVVAPAGVIIKDSPSQKEEIWVEGNSLDDVSLTCAKIHQHTHIHNKDLRKFLDGIYVSEKGFIEEEE